MSAGLTAPAQLSTPAGPTAPAGATAPAGLSTPAIAGVVAAGTPIETVREGFQGTEGPLALPDGSLLFVENQASRVTRIGVDGSVSVLLRNPAGPNALALDPHGDLVAVLTRQPGVAVIYPANEARTLVAAADGKPFNRPNDLVLDHQGGVYFTDPGGRVKPGEPRPATAVYYLSPTGTLRRLAADIALPNGIQLSPDEKTLYVADTRGEYVLAYDVGAAGVVGAQRNFARIAGPPSADGLAVDRDGRLYVATATGVQVFGPQGAALGVIAMPQQPQNLAFAGHDKRALYVVGHGAVYRIMTLTRGFGGRAK